MGEGSGRAEPSTLPGVLAAAAGSDPDGVALVAGPTRLTFAELHRRSEVLARDLASLAGPGDRVVLLSGNRAEVVEAYYGVPSARMVLAPLNPRLHPEEWIAALARIGAAVLVGEGPLLERLRAHPGAAAALAGVAIRELPPEGAAGAAAPADGDGGDRSGAGPPRDADPSDPAWLMGTSGTTGPPRHAVLTHRSLLAAARATAAARDVRPGDTLLTPFPLCHVAGYNVVVHHLRARPVVVMRRFDPAELLALVREHRVTTLSMAPTMIAMLLDHLGAHPGPEPASGGRHPAVPATLRSIGYGASPIHRELLRRGLTVLGCDFVQGYGMTELSGNAVFLGPEEHRRAAAGDDDLAAAAGRPAPGVELRIAGAEGDPAAVGEILVRAEQVAAGYWRDPESTRDTFVGGWLRTGDVGRIDADGLLHVVDRAKDVVVTGGENVASREVEDVLRRHPSVRDVAVIGLPDPRWGERVCAVVVPEAGPRPAASELEALARRHLAGFKVPRRVELVAELPRNPTGKIDKAALRRRFGAG